MALATRCPHCQTTFRVANDQLKLHAGMVRCGSCNEVFNGIEHLVALPAGAPHPAPAHEALAATAFETASAATPEAIPEEAFAPSAPLPAEPAEQHGHHDHNANTAFADAVSSADESAGAEPDQTLPEPSEPYEDALLSAAEMDFILGEESPAVIPTATRAEPVIAEPEPIEPPALDTAPTDLDEPGDTSQPPHQEPYLDESAHPLTSEAEAAEVPETAGTHEPADEHDKPAFVIAAERAQKRSRVLKIAMLLSCLLLLPLLAGQSLYALRNPLAAWFPELKPGLAQACLTLHCRLQMPAQIEHITIESNELTTLSEERHVFMLALQLQNHSNTLQSWPVVELVLNDARDKAVLQRAFTPAEYLPAKTDSAKGFPAASEQNLKIYFELPKLKAAGYRVAVFYP